MTTLMCKWNVNMSSLSSYDYKGMYFDSDKQAFEYIEALTEGFKCDGQAKNMLVTPARHNNKVYIRIADMAGTPIGYLQDNYPNSTREAAKTNTVLNTAVDSNTESNTEKVQANENVAPESMLAWRKEQLNPPCNPETDIIISNDTGYGE